MAMRFSTKRKLLDGSLLEMAEKRFWEIAAQEEKITQKPKKTTEKKERKIFAFVWSGKKPNEQLEFLHKQLIENKFISSDTLQDLVKGAFSGCEIIKPLKIKWIVKGKNKSISKPSLLRFIDLLITRKFIDGMENSILYDKIKNIFVDHMGNPLKNLKQSNQSNLNRAKANKPPEIEKLDHIISAIPK